MLKVPQYRYSCRLLDLESMTKMVKKITYLINMILYRKVL